MRWIYFSSIKCNYYEGWALYKITDIFGETVLSRIDGVLRLIYYHHLCLVRGLLRDIFKFFIVPKRQKALGITLRFLKVRTSERSKSFLQFSLEQRETK